MECTIRWSVPVPFPWIIRIRKMSCSRQTRIYSGTSFFISLGLKVCRSRIVITSYSIHYTKLYDIAQRLPLTEGAEELVSQLKALGFKTAILSGGFTYFGRYLQQKLGFDYVYANELDIRDGKVTGEVVGTVVNGERKAQLLREIAEREGVRSYNFV